MFVAILNLVSANIVRDAGEDILKSNVKKKIAMLETVNKDTQPNADSIVCTRGANMVNIVSMSISTILIQSLKN